MQPSGNSGIVETLGVRVPATAGFFGVRRVDSGRPWEANPEGELMASISEQLRKAIKSSGQSYYALAQQTGVDAAVILRFVNGERDLRLETAAKLAEKLGLDLRPRK